MTFADKTEWIIQEPYTIHCGLFSVLFVYFLLFNGSDITNNHRIAAKLFYIIFSQDRSR